MLSLSIPLCLLLPLPFAPCSQDSVAEGYAHPELLVSVERLAAGALSSPAVLIDVRDAASYGAGHLPGARSLPVVATFDPERPGDLGSAEYICAALGQAGLTPADHVLLVDDGRSTLASRMFWTLEALGHTRVSVVNGGVERWVSEGHELTQQSPAHEATTYPVPRGVPRHLSTLGQIQGQLEEEACVVLDARSDREYAAGHLPGAIHVEWVRNFTVGEAPVWLAASELRSLYAELLDVAGERPIHACCRSGQRSTVTYLALRLLGQQRVTNYDGAWREWAAAEGAPIER